jgi:hypothetical protein
VTLDDAPSSAREPVLRAEANLCQSVRVWARACLDGSLDESPGLIVTRAGVPIRSFNQIILTERVRGHARLQEAIASYPGKFRLRARSDIIDPETAGVLESFGMKEQGGIPCLVADYPGEVDVVVSGLEIRSVADEQSLHDHVSVVAQSFG